MGGEEPAPASFYDDLADSYHLIFEDWDEAIGRAGEVLDRLLRAEGHPPPAAVLDCFCGVGTQVLGLARLGYDVRGTDLSDRSVARARREAGARGLAVSFDVADVRALGAAVEGTFDVVVSCDNSLPHLLTDEDLALALSAMRGCLRPGGLLLASMRDYDGLTDDALTALRPGQGGGGRPTGTLPRVLGAPGERRLVVQAWTWESGAPVYDLELFVVLEQEGTWRTSCFRGRYRAYLRSEVNASLREAGFERARWLMPEETGYYQPVVVARVPSDGV